LKGVVAAVDFLGRSCLIRSGDKSKAGRRQPIFGFVMQSGSAAVPETSSSRQSSSALPWQSWPELTWSGIGWPGRQPG